jgi:hypothetical protein
LTKHLPDEINKLHMSLEDAHDLITENVILNSATLNVSHSLVTGKINSLNKVQAKPLIIRTKPKASSMKNRLGKILHKLYDLEPETALEKPLNVDLCINLYQMENF